MRRLAAFSSLALAQSLAAQAGTVVSPGVVSLDSVYEMNTTFSHAGTRMYFSRCSGRGAALNCRIYMSIRGDQNVWGAPAPASFSTTTSDFDPAVSHDGSRMIFLSKRPRPGDTQPRADWDIWIMERQGDGWSEPRWLPPPISSNESEYFASLTPQGDLVFSSIRVGTAGAGDIWIAKRTPAGLAAPQPFSPNVNSVQFESDPLMSSDGSFLLFTSYGRPGAPGDGDLFVSHRRGDDWLPAEMLDGVNTPARECCATITPDGRRLMFTREVNRLGQIMEMPLVAAGLTTASGLPGTLDSVRTVRVAGNVHMVSWYSGSRRMNTTLLAGPDGVFAVDIPGREVGDTIQAIAKALAPLGIRTIASTHWHTDHTGGNKYFGGLVPIIAHPTVTARRSVAQTPSWGGGGIARLPRHALPTVLVTDSLAQTWNGERVLLMSVGPAHTDGDLIVFFEQSRVAAVGDLYHGRGRLAGNDFHSGDGTRLGDALAAIERRLPRDTKIVTGHGGVSTMAELSEFRQRYQRMLQRLRPAVAAGQPRDSVVRIATEEWAGWDAPQRDINLVIDGILPFLRRAGKNEEQLR